MFKSIVVAGALLVAATPGPAVAREPDPSITLLTPADGAVVQPDPEGVTVSFACPGFALPYGRPNYSVSFNTTGAMRDAEDLDAEWFDSELSFDGVSCSARLRSRVPAGADVFDDYLRPEVSGGSIYWQVQRSGVDDPTSRVGSFVVAQPSAGRLRAPSRMFATYPRQLVFDTDAEVYGAPAQLERLEGTAWVTVRTDEFRGRTRFFTGLPAGRQQVRVTLRLPSGPLSTEPRQIRVAGHATSRSTSPSDTGRYGLVSLTDGFPGQHRGRLRVLRRGRVLSEVRLQLTGLCISWTGGGSSLLKARFKKVRVAPDGTFAQQVVSSDGERTWQLWGRLRDGRVRAHVDLSQPGCVAFGLATFRQR